MLQLKRIEKALRSLAEGFFSMSRNYRELCSWLNRAHPQPRHCEPVRTLVWQSVPLTSVARPSLRRPHFLWILPKENGGKERPLSVSQAFPATIVPLAGRGLMGTWEGFDCCSIPALPRDANRVSVSARFAAIALARFRAGCAAPSAFVQLPYDNSTKIRNVSFFVYLFQAPPRLG